MTTSKANVSASKAPKASTPSKAPLGAEPNLTGSIPTPAPVVKVEAVSTPEASGKRVRKSKSYSMVEFAREYKISCQKGETAMQSAARLGIEPQTFRQKLGALRELAKAKGFTLTEMPHAQRGKKGLTKDDLADIANIFG